LHMFDQYAIVSLHIFTRQANVGVKMTILYDKERDFLLCEIVFTNGQTPIGLACVMCGYFSEVTEQTSDIVSEGAILDPVSISHTSRRLT
ncbi:phenylalanine--tRNA ligase beta subunit-related protein, partial [Staphylococcus aureus]